MTTTATPQAIFEEKPMHARRMLLGMTVTAGAVAGLILATGAQAATFNAPVVVSSADDSEPGVDVAPDGTLYVNAPDGGTTYPQHMLAATPLDQTGCICPPGNIIAEDGGLTGDKVGGVYSTSVGGVGFYGSTNGGLTFTNTVPGPASNADTSAAFPVVADNGSGSLAV